MRHGSFAPGFGFAAPTRAGCLLRDGFPLLAAEGGGPGVSPRFAERPRNLTSVHSAPPDP